MKKCVSLFFQMQKMEKWLFGLRRWTCLNVLLMAVMLVMRPVFFLEVQARVGLESIHLLTILSGALYDLLLVCRVFTFGLIPFVLLYRWFPKTAVGLFKGWILLYAVVSALLAEYYCDLGMPLDHVILVYTPDELRTTVFSSASLSWSQVLWFVAMVAVPVLLVLLLHAKERRAHAVDAVVLVGCVAATLLVDYHELLRTERLYPTHYDFCLAVNQPSYAVVKMADYWRDDARQQTVADDILDHPELMTAVEAYHARHPEFDYVDDAYPFYRQANDPDVLGPFFRPTEDGLPPNLVVVVVEGFGRRLTAVDEPVLSFTPFIDSLATEGLFWPNCLATSERTFGVLPSVFASAPYGRYGFSTPLATTPRHHSLLRDLKRNGYDMAFYYGGDMAFDRYDFFLKANHVDDLFEPEVAVTDSAVYRALVENNRWGLDDGQLFEAAIDQMHADTFQRRPRLDIYLTLSTHEPFLIDDIGRFEDEVKRIVEQTPGVSEKERNNVLKNLNVYACFLYLDQCFRELFAYYASRPEFANTVFVVTGDHRMGMLPFGSPIHKYNVPLVVYSPLLKRAKTMEAVVSHLDVAPSLNAFLHANYDYAIDGRCHWLGTAFDTATAFRNTRQMAFMLNNRDVVEYYRDEVMLSRNRLIKMDSLFRMTAVDDDSLLALYQAELHDFDLLSRFVVQNDKLLPQEEAVRTLYSSHLDFGRNMLGIFDPYWLKEEECLGIGATDEYVGLCSDVSLKPIYQDVWVEVAFDYRDASSEPPRLAVHLGEETHHQLLVPSTENGVWTPFHVRVMLNAFAQQADDKLSIYLWNPSGGSVTVDNLSVTVTASLR